MSTTAKPSLGQIEAQLSPRDRHMLNTIRSLRHIKTGQIRRLYFPQKGRSENAVRTANKRTLRRLKKLGLIDHLPKRIGGMGAGEQEYIWFITEAGIRLLTLGTEQEGKRKRVLEPSPAFLRHTIAVTETFIQIVEICRDDPAMRVGNIEVEPECWRAYEKNGKVISLRPDLYAKTYTGDYAYHMFIEMDLATEALQFVIEKCRRYHEYYRTGKEQNAYGAFPLVLWIVPDEDRKRNMVSYMKEAFGKRGPSLFYVITPHEIEAVLRDGVTKEELC